MVLPALKRGGYNYYTSGALAEHLIHASFVHVVTLEAFIRLANNGKI